VEPIELDHVHDKYEWFNPSGIKSCHTITFTYHENNIIINGYYDATKQLIARTWIVPLSVKPNQAPTGQALLDYTRKKAREQEKRAAKALTAALNKSGKYMISLCRLIVAVVPICCYIC
jgi:hypothetical protein